MKIWLKFPSDMVGKPILSNSFKNFDIDFNILKANITPQGGEMLLDVDGENIDDFIKKVEDYYIEVDKVRKVLKKSEENCINCGGCVSLCPVSAIIIADNWKIEFDDKLCIGCGFCVESCPTHAVKLV